MAGTALVPHRGASGAECVVEMMGPTHKARNKMRFCVTPVGILEVCDG